MITIDRAVEAAASLTYGPNPPASRETFSAVLRERLVASEAAANDPERLAREIAAFGNADDA